MLIPSIPSLATRKRRGVLSSGSPSSGVWSSGTLVDNGDQLTDNADRLVDNFTPEYLTDNGDRLVDNTNPLID